MALTIGDLKEQLRDLPDDMEIVFADGLDFHRLKQRGENLLQFEFYQSVYKDKAGVWHVDQFDQG